MLIFEINNQTNTHLLSQIHGGTMPRQWHDTPVSPSHSPGPVTGWNMYGPVIAWNSAVWLNSSHFLWFCLYGARAVCEHQFFSPWSHICWIWPKGIGLDYDCPFKAPLRHSDNTDYILFAFYFSPLRNVWASSMTGSLWSFLSFLKTVNQHRIHPHSAFQSWCLDRNLHNLRFLLQAVL